MTLEREQDRARTSLRRPRLRPPAILRAQRNCWRVRRACRASILVDAGAYFRVLGDAIERAQRSVMILGWDFDHGIALEPGSAGPRSRPLREYLLDLLERRPALEVRILIWSSSVVYGEGRRLPPQLDRRWPRHPRLVFRFAYDHPLFAAHHEKLVVVDDALAFCGGIDLTGCRWDDRSHAALHPLRVDPRGRPYDPKHDVQLAVDGAAARACGLLARRRWLEATGERLAPVPRGFDPWPETLAPLVGDVDVGVARTRPRRGVRESEALVLDALAGARERIYVETQYLTATRIGDRLIEILRRPKGPEVVCIVRRRCDGILQRFAMGSNRDRLLRRLIAADEHRRLRAFYPVVLDDDGVAHEVYVHSKLLAVDDRLLRVGSANLNNRSMSYDTECDLALEADCDEQRAALARVPPMLVAEHLGREPEDVERALAETGSLGAAIERLGGHPRRRLVAYDPDLDGPWRPFPGTHLVDPDRPRGAARRRPDARG